VAGGMPPGSDSPSRSVATTRGSGGSLIVTLRHAPDHPTPSFLLALVRSVPSIDPLLILSLLLPKVNAPVRCRKDKKCGRPRARFSKGGAEVRDGRGACRRATMTEPSAVQAWLKPNSEGIGARRHAPRPFLTRPPYRLTAVSLEPLRKQGRGGGSPRRSYLSSFANDSSPKSGISLSM
jgi:hypothetical protein